MSEKSALRWCGQCKRNLPLDQFLPIRKRGWRVTKCDRCAHENMVKWARRVETDPDRVARQSVAE